MAAKLDAALLVAADLGAGWSVVAGPADSDDDEPVTASAGSCDLGQFDERNVVRDRTVDLQQAQAGGFAFVTHEIEVYKPGVAAPTLRQGRELFQRCKQLTQRDEGETSTLTLAALAPVPSLGDETIGTSVSATQQGITVRGAIIIIRKGDYLTSILAVSTNADATNVALAAAQKVAAKLPT